MGRNSKARRDARRRKRPHQGQRGAAGGSTGPFGPFGDRTDQMADPFAVDPVAVADLHLTAAVRRLGATAKTADAIARAGQVRRSCDPIAPRHLGRALDDLLDRLVDAVLVGGGWGPAEIAEAVDRIIGAGHGDVVAGLVGRARRRRPFNDPRWDTEVEQLPPRRGLDVRTDEDLALGLQLAALIAVLPGAAGATDETGSVGPGPAPGSRAEAKLAQVRALLAKAEATSYPEEAEALSAKAQDLISRYSLELLLDRGADAGGQRRASSVTYRRMWLDAPYVNAKANLVNEVAAVNRSRCVLDPRLGLCTLVGAPFDLDAVELLVTSLLIQAQRAMLAHGSARDARGASRTRSFRQSFLVSFAVHIGERLRQTTAESVEATGQAASLLPAIRERKSEVHELTDRLFPDLVTKETQVTNAVGWASGRAAAELAILDVYGRLPDDAASGEAVDPPAASGASA